MPSRTEPTLRKVDARLLALALPVCIVSGQRFVRGGAMAGASRFRRGGSGRPPRHTLWRMVALALLALSALNAPARAQTPPAERPYEEFGAFWVDRSQPDAIYLSGPISSEAILDLRRARRAYPDAHILVLNSPGGLISTGLAIADEIHEAGFSTVIPSWAGCYSACSFLFFAGVERLAVGELGVHQFTGDQPDFDMAQRTVADVLEILARFDTPQTVISLMLRTPPEDMYVFTTAEIEEYGINRGFAQGATAYEAAGDTLPQLASGLSPSAASLIVDPDGINQRVIDGTVTWERAESDGQTALIGTVHLGQGEANATIVISPPLDPTQGYGVVLGVQSDSDLLLGSGNGRTVELWAEDADGELRPTTLGGTESDDDTLYIGSDRRWLALDLVLVRDATTIDLVFREGSTVEAILTIPVDPDGVVTEVAAEWLQQSEDMPLSDPPYNGPRNRVPLTVSTGTGNPTIDGTVDWYTSGRYLAARVEIPSRDLWFDLSFSDESALMVFYPPSLFTADPFRVALLGAQWENYDAGVFVAPLNDPLSYIDSVGSIDVMLRLASGETLIVSLAKDSAFAVKLAEARQSWSATAPAVTPQIVDAPDLDLERRVAVADVQAGGSTATQCVACHSLTHGGGTRIGPNLYDIVGAPIARTEGFDYSRGLEALHEAGAKWTVEQLNFFLAGPNTAVPGTAMAHPGITNSQDRVNVIAFLRSLSPNPVELATAPVAAMPDWRLPPTFGELKLLSSAEPQTRRIPVQSGGPINAGTALGGRCAGFIAEAPDYRLHYQPGDHPLTLSVDALTDTVLVVNGPNGDWFCDDDSGGGANPLIRWGNPVAGEYDIWVGTYADTTNHGATLVISEADDRPPEAGNTPTVPADDTAQPDQWQDVQFVASYQDWSVFADSDGCFIAAVSLSGEPDNPTVDPAYIMVLDEPASANSPQMAFLLGYNLDGRYYATASVDGGRSFNLLPDATNAFVNDPAEERALIAAMRQGVQLVLTGRTPGGTTRTDVFSLLGFTAALQRAQTGCGG